MREKRLKAVETLSKRLRILGAEQLIHDTNLDMEATGNKSERVTVREISQKSTQKRCSRCGLSICSIQLRMGRMRF